MIGATLTCNNPRGYETEFGAVICENCAGEIDNTKLVEGPFSQFPNCEWCNAIIENGIVLNHRGLVDLAKFRLSHGLGSLVKSPRKDNVDAFDYFFKVVETGGDLHGPYETENESVEAMGRWIYAKIQRDCK